MQLLSQLLKFNQFLLQARLYLTSIHYPLLHPGPHQVAVVPQNHPNQHAHRVVPIHKYAIPHLKSQHSLQYAPYPLVLLFLQNAQQAPPPSPIDERRPHPSSLRLPHPNERIPSPPHQLEQPQRNHQYQISALQYPKQRYTSQAQIQTQLCQKLQNSKIKVVLLYLAPS